MGNAFAPVGPALPPRRDQLVSAAAVSAPPEPSNRSGWGESINVPMARDRMLEFFEREQLPGDVKSTLAAALNGDLHLQSLLFTAMIDTWPKLQKNLSEVARLVSVAPWKIKPFAMRGEKPDSAAEALAKDVENLVWGMKPRAARREQGFEGTIKALVLGYYYGHAVAEIRWENSKDGWKPRCTKTVPARYYGYPYNSLALADDPEDRLMFDPSGMMGPQIFEDFPEHRFLIAINGGHAGHSAVAAPLRALAGYWLAAVYGLKWFLNFTQLYGIPWRHAECDLKDENAVKTALASIGANGYLVTRPGTKINVLDSAKTGDSLPQKAMIDLADQQCDTFVLGQTLTSGTDHAGSRALGDVHQATLNGVIDGVSDFVGEILTHQLIPAIVSVNWGEDRDDLPELWAKREETKDEKALADRDVALGVTTGKVKVGESWFYERHGIPMPAAGDKLLMDDPVPPAIDPNAPKLGPDGKPLPTEPLPMGKPPVKKPVEDKAKAVKAADAEQMISPLTVEQLSDSVLEGLTGVASEWLSPVRPFFERLAALAMSKHVSDADFIAALEAAQKQLPELFDVLDTEALQTAFEDAIGSAALAGSVRRYE